MCGIAGIIHPRPRPLAASVAAAMQACQAHRGPDDQGVFCFGRDGMHTGHVGQEESAVQVAFFHRRLSILDLSEAGWQPMRTPDGRYHLIFNGEIYNYVELREQLKAEGWGAFRSDGDTEVLLAGFACWGPDVVHRLVGMFAFAVFDAVAQHVFLARDFAGIKPLYYTFWQGGLAFASEIKTLLGLPGMQRKANPQQVYDYLVHGFTDAGAATFFEGIYALPAGHEMEVSLAQPDRPQVRRYWQPAGRIRQDLSFDEAAARLRELFLESVRLHMRSDVPLGAALSGGIDSSAIVSAMRHLCPEAELHAVSYVAADEALSEERWIDLVGKAFGASVHKVRPAPEELAADLNDLIRVQDEPFVSTSIYAQYRVFRGARSAGLKVMLDGQGADELLGVYKLYLAARLATFLRQGRIDRALRLLRHLARRPMAGGAAAQLAYAMGMVLPERAQAALMRLTRRTPIPAGLQLAWFDDHAVRQRLHQWKATSPDVLHEMLRRTFTETSLPMLLRYEDRNSMAFSIESRVPFLTPDLVQFVLSLPADYLIDARGETKAVFRAAMRGLVPDAVLDRKDKIGFVTPQAEWLRRLAPWVDAALGSDAALRIPFLDSERLSAAWANVRDEGNEHDFRILWRWINLIRWAEQQDVTFE